MPEGLVRSDLNNGGGSSRNGNPVPPNAEGDNSNPVTWTPNPAQFGNPVPAADESFDSNVVDWDTPDPAHFGNTISGGPA